MTNRGGSILPPLTVLMPDFVEQLDELSFHNRLLEYHFARADPACAMRIDYQDLLDAPEQTLRRVLVHINGSAAGMRWPISERVTKSTPRNFSAGLTNWQYLRDELARDMPWLLDDIIDKLN